MIETGGSVRRGLVLTALAAGAALLIAGCRSEATPNLESLDHLHGGVGHDRRERCSH